MSVDWNSIVTGCALTALVHPFTNVKVLFQLGYEPLYPTKRKNLILQNELQYPPVTSYIRYIGQRNGFFGLYKGVIPRVCANATTSLTYSILSNAFGYDQADLIFQNAVFNEENEIIGTTSMHKHTSRETLFRCISIIASHPFHVISIRCMAQLVGEETTYNSLTGSFKIIYEQEGIPGFFKGLIPRLACELLSFWICSFLSRLMDNYILNDPPEVKDLRYYNHLLMSYIAQVITYPLSVCSTVMAVNGCGLMAGNPPFTPIYKDWTTCLFSLHEKGLAHRGSSLFFRKAVNHVITASNVNPKPSSEFKFS